MPRRKINPSRAANNAIPVRKISATISGEDDGGDDALFEHGRRSTRARGRDRRATETSFAARVVIEGTVEFGVVHIGPQGVGEIQFRIGELPQQKIADAVLAAG